MAPAFLSKFIKSGSPTPHSRTQSDASGSSSQLSHKSSSTHPSPNVSQQVLSRPTIPKNPSTVSLNKLPIIKIDASAGASKTSLVTMDSGASSQPIVTVIPPSPRSDSVSSYFDNTIAETSDRIISDTDLGAGKLSSSGRTISVTPNITPLPTPTAVSTSSSPSSKSQASHSTSPPLTPSTPPDHDTSSDMPKTLEPKSQEVRRSASNRSLQVSTNHPRAATSPETTRDSGQGENGAIIMTPIVESPTGLRIDFSSLPSTEQVIGSASLLPPRDSDAVSLMSTTTNGGTKEKRRPWKKSTTRKPTGLASAIAASGMAMAQPTLSAAQQATFSSATHQARAIPVSSRKSSTAGSPPYSTRSPPGSSSHVKRKSTEFSPASRSKGLPSVRSGGRGTAVSVASDNASEYYPEDRPEYYSGLEVSEDEDESEENESILEEMEDMPVTGFAVASNKRNADFHELFPNIPEGDYLIEDYGCALQRDILVQGRLYISENHICFHANIFGWITDLSIPMYEITQLEKRMTAFVIPNAIQITTRQAKYTFASFLSRDTTHDVIYNIWRLARPEDGINSSRPSLDGVSIGPAPNTIQTAAVPATTGVLVKLPKVTKCACSKDGGHYSETALDCILPGTPERIHNLIFASGFIKDFMSIDQKLLDIQMSDWQPTAPGSNLLTRNMSYIKPLNASLGPKSTKCEIKDEMVHNDPEQYISTVTTTRTPDVPSGGVFSVKTRTCVMWASSVSTILQVTTQVEWTGRSFIRSIIEKSAIDGQKTYHAELEKSMRKYIQEHQSEFVPEGIDTSVLPAVAPMVAMIGGALASSAEKLSSEEENKRREHERNQRGLQWAWDTFEGASQVAIRSTKDALELIRDAWEQSSSTTIMWFVIVALVLSNLWSLVLMGSREEAGRRKEMKKMEEREKWVQGVVTSLWDELSKQHQLSVGGGGTTGNGALGTNESPSTEGFSWVPNLASPHPSAWKKEIGDMQDVLDRLEERVKVMKESLREVREVVTRLDEVD